MREIKFKVWCKDYNEWEKDLILITSNGTIFTECRGGIMPIKPDNHIVVWNTGLKDKNGKEIYEGDIVNCTCMQDWNIPEWWNGDNTPRNVVIEDIRNLPWEIEEHPNYFKVIGNIYETPLKEE